MNVHQSEQFRQHAHYSEVKKRIASGKPAPKALPSADDTVVIGELRAEVATLTKSLERARANLRYVADREEHHRNTDRKIELLELDLADARARILSQAEMLKAIDGEDEGQTLVDRRRSVPEIVADVLQNYPGVTWEDVKGIRRTRDLIAPRHACMRAVYDERKDLSLPRIGKLFQRDHTTILHAVQK